MQKLIKLNDQHYIIVDDSEIKEGDWYVGWENNYSTEPKQRWVLYNLVSTTNGDTPRKITHSTEPLEYKYGSQKQGFNMGTMSSDIKLVYDQIKPLSISEVEEAINGYSVEKMAEDAYPKNENWRINSDNSDKRILWVEGFKAHQELTKDKFFTVEDIKIFYKHVKTHTFDEAISLILPKTEWDIEFDEQGKISLGM